MEGLSKVCTVCTFTWQCIYFDFSRKGYREGCYGRVIPTLATTTNAATSILFLLLLVLYWAHHQKIYDLDFFLLYRM